MYLKDISLQNFRSYAKAQFTFNPKLTIVVGSNASGKTNLVEAIGLLSLGKSFRTSKEKQLVAFGETIARVKGTVLESVESESVIEVMIAELPGQMLKKKYLINGIAKRRASLTGILPTVFFTPLDLALV